MLQKMGGRTLGSTDQPQTPTIPTFKVIVAGDGGVGKTSLIRRYCTGKFQESRLMTIGVDFQTQIVEINKKPVKLSIWDIAGQERFGSFRASFYRGAKAVALVYDVTGPVSLTHLPNWHSEIARVVPDVRFLVVGNKVDLERQVPKERVIDWTRSSGLPYLETSAKTGQGVRLFFEGLARLALAARSY
jgi:small GTP-binding protein